MQNVLVGLAIVVIGCGQAPKSRREGAARILPLTADEAFAERYFLSDAECQENQGISDIGSPLVYSWSDGRISTKSFPRKGFSSIESIAGPAIESTVFNMLQKTTCIIDANGVSCPEGTQVIEEPKPLKICQKEQNFARNSVEGIALSSIASLTETQNFYLQIDTSKKDIRAAQVIVLPTIETVVESVSTQSRISRRAVITDNLAYAPSFGGKPAFVIFPKGKKAFDNGLWKDLNLWELSWGLSHEYAHHIFMTHLRKSFMEEGQLIPIHSFDFEEKKSRVERLAGESNAQLSLNAINEGFADLFAYYAMGEKKGLTTGVDCFERSRDVESRSFYNGTAKRLTDRVLTQFESQQSSGSLPCTAPSFEDIHTIGAVVSHGAHRLISASPNINSREKKAQILLQWVDTMGARLAEETVSQVNLQSLLADFVRIFSQKQGTLTKEQCLAIEDVFPAFTKSWTETNSNRQALYRCSP